MQRDIGKAIPISQEQTWRQEAFKEWATEKPE